MNTADANKSQDKSQLADVLIIGAGASGAVAARRLAEEGFNVVCLEQGDRVDPSSIPSAKPEFELLTGKEWSFNPNVRELLSDYPLDTSEAEVIPLMFNGVGGSTVLYGSHWMRLLPSDFRVRSLDGVADDWPITYQDLVPYYERIDLDIGASGLGGDPAYPPGKPPPLPPIPIGSTGMAAARGMDAMGWHWWPGTNSIPTRPYRLLSPCTRRGTCNWGCPEGAKASLDRTHWPVAEAHGARLITGARVREISVNAEGLATGAIYLDRKGQEHFQRAQVVILAANGIGTPRLLLLSTSNRFPDGLANSSGLVGKRLMMHPYGQVVGIFEEELDSWWGPWGQRVYSLEFYETDARRGFVRGAKWAAMPTGGPMITMAECGVNVGDNIWGENLHKSMHRWFGHSVFWGIIAEDLPEESNRVTLDAELTDSDGIPTPKITYRISENSHRILDFHLARAKEAMEAAGAAETISSLVADTGWHLLGTARMGTDPRTSVVDAWGRAHDVPNLCLIDGSIFTTGAGLNPTATICALALRNVEKIIADRRNMKTT